MRVKCRPLCAAVAAAGRGAFTLDGVPRMRERPIQDLVDGLRQLGVDASCTRGTGCPPVAIDARGLPTGTVRQASVRRVVTPAAPFILSRSHRIYGLCNEAAGTEP